ncbi:hypothetical protein N2152v2_009937 [Parachlorella kessleri]
MLSLLLFVTAVLAASSEAAAPSIPDFLTGYISRRAVEIPRERAKLEADLDAAAKTAAAIAAAPRYKRPTVKTPVGNVKYVDLSRVGLRPQVPGGLNFNSGGSYPRYPAPRLPPQPNPITTCPELSSVKKFGAKGDGFTDDSGAFQAASAATSVTFVYLPPGNYRIAKSTTLTKPILAGTGAKLTIAAGVILTLKQRVYQHDVNGALFAGPGAVRLTTNSDTLRPSWFKNEGETDTMALQQAVDSCGGACILMLHAPMVLNKAVKLKPPVGIFSTTGALILGNRDGSRGEGFVLTPGRYRRPLLLGTMWGFKSYGVRIQGGVTGAEIQVQGFLEGSEGITFAAMEGSRSITNVYVTHLTFTNAVQHTVVFRAGASSDLINNCLVRGNFVVTPGFFNPNARSAALTIKGTAPPKLVKTSVEFQAIDAAQHAQATQFMFLRNEVGAPTKDLVFKVSSWGGGLVAGAGKLVGGKFSTLKYLARMSGGVPDTNWQSTLSGQSNYVTMWEVASAGWELPMPSTPNRAAFNGGVSVNAQVQYVQAPITGTWNPGETRTFYFYSVYARSAGSRIKCLPFRAGNPGLVCSRIENQSGTAADQIAVTLLNTAGYAMPFWMNLHRFAVQVGP